MEQRVWILGASSSEMDLIEQVLAAAREEVLHALDEDGERVGAGNAHQARTPDHDLVWQNGTGTIYAVECSWEHLDGETGDVIHISAREFAGAYLR